MNVCIISIIENETTGDLKDEFCYALTETIIEITTGSVENKIRGVGIEQKVVQEKLKELREHYNEAFTVLSEVEGEIFSLKRGTTIITMQIKQVRLLEDE